MNFKIPVILASNSPRRKQLLSELGVTFTVKSADVDETVPVGMDCMEVPEYLAQMKARAVHAEYQDSLVIAADTVVILDQAILGKPKNREQAKRYLLSLSGKEHQVVTGVYLIYQEKILTFKESTIVSFKSLTNDEIDYYLDHYHPMDKAGAYGIQEWIGMIGVTKIEGSYFNVVGLPVARLYQELQKLAVSAYLQ